MNFVFNNSSIVSVNSGTIVLNVSGKTRTFIDAKLVSAVDGKIVLDLLEPIYNEGNYLVIDLGNVQFRTFIVQGRTEQTVAFHVSEIKGTLLYYGDWSLSDKDPIRNATPEEIQELNDQLAAEGKRWNPNTMQIERLRWKPDQGTAYFHIFIAGGIVRTDNYIWMDDVTDKNYYEMGNCFKTRAEAEAKLKQIKQILNR